MDEYKPNSEKYKKEMANKEKQLTKVISGTAKTKKRSEMQKFKNGVIENDIYTVGKFVLWDVIIPALKDLIYDVVTNGTDAILFKGEGRVKHHKNGSSKINYSGISSSMSRRDERDRIESYSRIGGGVFDYDDITYESRGDAEAVLTALEEVIDTFTFASVGDLYDLSEISTNNYAVNKYGWNDISSAKVVMVRGGRYMIKLPRPIPLR